jgi:hypothetical protein
MKKIFLSLFILASISLVGCSTKQSGNAMNNGYWFLNYGALSPISSSLNFSIPTLSGSNSSSSAALYVDAAKKKIYFNGSLLNVSGSGLSATLNHGFIFAGNPSNLAAATSTIFLRSGKVGVGTTSPTQLFTVGNHANFTVNSVGNITGGTFNGYTPQSNSLVKNYLWLGNGSGVATAVASNTLPYSPASTVSSQWVTGGSNIYFNTGNVGIGTSSVASKLNIDSGSAATTTISIGNDKNYSCLSFDENGIKYYLDFTKAAQGTLRNFATTTQPTYCY